MIRRLQEVAAERRAGRVTFEQFRAATGLSDRHITRHFGGYNDFVRAAGLTPYTANQPLSDDELLRAVHDAWIAAGGPVPPTVLDRVGRHRFGAYKRRWKTWANALTAFRRWTDVNAPAFPHRAALLRAEERERQRASRRAPIDGRRYGDVLNFRNLLHAPVSELGVVLLFGMVAGELGFIIESVASEFPDCEAKRRAPGGGWERLRLEFELASANFETHGHDAGACDLVVCWEHDWPDCPLPVLELKSEIERLRIGSDAPSAQPLRLR
jgi:hypothetical protein